MGWAGVRAVALLVNFPYTENFSAGSWAAWGRPTRTKMTSWVSPRWRTSCVSSTWKWTTCTPRCCFRWSFLSWVCAWNKVLVCNSLTDLPIEMWQIQIWVPGRRGDRALLRAADPSGGDWCDLWDVCENYRLHEPWRPGGVPDERAEREGHAGRCLQYHQEFWARWKR